MSDFWTIAVLVGFLALIAVMAWSLWPREPGRYR